MSPSIVTFRSKHNAPPNSVTRIITTTLHRRVSNKPSSRVFRALYPRRKPEKSILFEIETRLYKSRNTPIRRVYTLIFLPATLPLLRLAMEASFFRGVSYGHASALNFPPSLLASTRAGKVSPSFPGSARVALAILPSTFRSFQAFSPNFLLAEYTCASHRCPARARVTVSRISVERRETSAVPAGRLLNTRTLIMRPVHVSSWFAVAGRHATHDSIVNN